MLFGVHSGLVVVSLKNPRTGKCGTIGKMLGSFSGLGKN
jgi:hypothetical protein